MEVFVQALSNAPELAPACDDAIQFALQQVDEKLVLVVLEHRQKTSRMLNLACRLGFREVASEILSSGVKIESEMENDERAIHVTAYNLHVELVSFLIERGADVRYVSTKFGSPVNAALEGLLASDSPRWQSFFPCQGDHSISFDIRLERVVNAQEDRSLIPSPNRERKR